MNCKEIKYSRHVVVQMFARSISSEQLVKVIRNGEIINEYPDDKPFPSKLLLGIVDERPIHVVIGVNKISAQCIVITAYEPDLKLWEPDFKRRRKL